MLAAVVAFEAEEEEEDAVAPARARAARVRSIWLAALWTGLRRKEGAGAERARRFLF